MLNGETSELFHFEMMYWHETLWLCNCSNVKAVYHPSPFLGSIERDSLWMWKIAQWVRCGQVRRELTVHTRSCKAIFVSVPSTPEVEILLDHYHISPPSVNPMHSLLVPHTTVRHHLFPSPFHLTISPFKVGNRKTAPALFLFLMYSSLYNTGALVWCVWLLITVPPVF